MSVQFRMYTIFRNCLDILSSLIRTYITVVTYVHTYVGMLVSVDIIIRMTGSARTLHVGIMYVHSFTLIAECCTNHQLLHRKIYIPEF